MKMVFENDESEDGDWCIVPAPARDDANCEDKKGLNFNYCFMAIARGAHHCILQRALGTLPPPGAY